MSTNTLSPSFSKEHSDIFGIGTKHDKCQKINYLADGHEREGLELFDEAGGGLAGAGGNGAAAC